MECSNGVRVDCDIPERKDESEESNPRLLEKGVLYLALGIFNCRTTAGDVFIH